MNKRCNLCGVLLDNQVESNEESDIKDRCENCQSSEIQPKKTMPIKGLFYIFDGLWILLKNPKLLKLSIVPILITVILLFSFVFFGFNYGYHTITSLIEIPSENIFINILKFVTLTLSPLFLAVGFFFLFMLLILPISSIISIPFFEPICIETEKYLGLTMREEKFKISDLKMMIKEILSLLGFKLFVLIFSLPLLFIPFVGYIAFLFILTLLTSIDFLDVIMARKKYVFREKIQFIKKNFLPFIMFSAPLMTLFWIPFLQLLLIPSTAVAATKFFLETEKNT